MKKGTQHDTASRLLIANSMKGKRNAVGNNGGRPERYQADYARQVYHVCLLGAVDTEIANFFDISVRTLNNWKKRYPEFMNGMWRGKTIADAEVANALYRSVCGYDYVETTVWVLKNAKGERFIRTVEVVKHMPPNVVRRQVKVDKRDKNEKRQFSKLFHSNHLSNVQFSQKILS